MVAGRSVLRCTPLTVIVLIAVLAVSGCSGDGEPKAGATTATTAPSGASPDGKPMAVRYSAWGRQGKVELLSLERVAGKAVAARFRLTNEGDQEYPVGTSLTGNGERNKSQPKAVDTNAISGISLLDGKNSRQYFPLNRNDGQCLCSRYHPTLDPVQPGKSYELRAAFPAPPSDVKNMSVLFPHAPPFLNVPLTDVGARTYTFDSEQGPLDPSKVDTAEPLILPVLSTIEEGARGQDDDGQNLRVRLATDVLFDTDKAELDATARERLKSVAAQIDRSKDTVVDVDGHTDDTGNDAINDPLSRRRADAVKTALEGLVTRSGVTFQARGHGSKQPVASNDNEEGKAKNRRVTVSFQRPAPPAPATPSADTSTPAGGAIEKWPRPVVARADIDPEDQKHGGIGGAPKKATAEINSLTRSPSGVATLVLTIVNNDGSIAYDPSLMSDLDGMYQGAGTSGVVLQAGDRRVRALRTEDRAIVGSPHFNSFGPGNRFRVEPGGRLTVWTTYKIPADITKVTVQIPGFEPAAGVAVN